MRIEEIDSRTFHAIRYTNAGKRGKTESAVLPFNRARVSRLPEGCDALIVTSDLQGVVPTWRGDSLLLGVALADELLELSERGMLPPPERCGVILAGDLYSAPGGDVRGASGDVREVWHALGVANAWVVGVQGNHDRFGPDAAHPFDGEPKLALLDVRTVEHGSVRISGIGGVIGDAAKEGRRQRDDFLAGIELLCQGSPDVLIMHEGPPGDEKQRGNPDVRDVVEQSKAQPLIICGHVHWDRPIHALERGPQILNVDARVVVLELDSK